jgi:hypothetical protein
MEVGHLPRTAVRGAAICRGPERYASAVCLLTLWVAHAPAWAVPPSSIPVGAFPPVSAPFLRADYQRAAAEYQSRAKAELRLMEHEGASTTTLPKSSH